MCRARKSQGGFTLIELMIMVAVLAILVVAVVQAIGRGSSAIEDNQDFIAQEIMIEYPEVIRVLSFETSMFGPVNVNVQVFDRQAEQVGKRTYCFDSEEFEEYDFKSRVPCN